MASVPVCPAGCLTDPAPTTETLVHGVEQLWTFRARKLLG